MVRQPLGAALTAGSRHSPPLLANLLDKPPRQTRSAPCKEITTTWRCHRYHSQAQGIWLTTAEQPGTTHRQPCSSSGPQSSRWPKSSQNPLDHTQKQNAAMVLRPCWKKRLWRKQSEVSFLFTPSSSSFLQKECSPCDLRSLQSPIQCE